MWEEEVEMGIVIGRKEQLIEPLYVQHNHYLQFVATHLAGTRRTKDINKGISGRVLENTPFEKSQI